MSTSDIRTLQRCEGRYCPIKQQCYSHRAEGHPSQPWPVDYSQAPTFKPSNAQECCPMFKPMELTK